MLPRCVSSCTVDLCDIIEGEHKNHVVGREDLASHLNALVECRVRVRVQRCELTLLCFKSRNYELRTAARVRLFAREERAQE